jgi:hypothetical protein
MRLMTGLRTVVFGSALFLATGTAQAQWPRAWGNQYGHGITYGPSFRTFTPRFYPSPSWGNQYGHGNTRYALGGRTYIPWRYGRPALTPYAYGITYVAPPATDTGLYTPRTTRNRLRAIALRNESDMDGATEGSVGSHPKLFGLDLMLISSLNDPIGIPTAAKGVIIVADVAHVLHFRVFNGPGAIVVDTNERKLAEDGGGIESIRTQLDALWPPHEPTKRGKVQIIPAITSLVGYTEPMPVGSAGCAISTANFAVENPALYERAVSVSVRIANDPTIQQELARKRESASYYGDTSVGRDAYHSTTPAMFRPR